MLGYPQHQQASLQGKVHIYGDSIFRDLQDNLERLDFNCEVFVLPGGTVSSLRTFIRDKDIFDVEDVEVVLLHIGTNNLSKNVWDWDKKSYTKLYTTVRERYPSSKIIFSAILPRWDCELLYEASLFYNLHLHSLTTSFWNCSFLDFSSPFCLYDDLFAYDGLHLNFFGKRIFSEEVRKGIVKSIQPSTGRKYVPPELKKLWTPRPLRKKKQNESLPSCQKTRENTCTPPPPSHRDESIPISSSRLPMSPPSSRETQSHSTSASQTCLTAMPSSCQSNNSQTSSPKSFHRSSKNRKKRRGRNCRALRMDLSCRNTQPSNQIISHFHLTNTGQIQACCTSSPTCDFLCLQRFHTVSKTFPDLILDMFVPRFISG
ncbi:uncharacterized protein LOC121410207 isoform X1 [Lytechinus variegatus]|uniref:uncharacterized protein LOC121410207 isoform X1 n=1 Tax=Lytechinus variegatus TaxID=7654 RepID=UPI001BB20F19|nr:uncharacterized protein LOC121410207 isoform X1 [Lytechinus variegatus]